MKFCYVPNNQTFSFEAREQRNHPQGAAKKSPMLLTQPFAN